MPLPTHVGFLTFPQSGHVLVQLCPTLARARTRIGQTRGQMSKPAGEREELSEIGRSALLLAVLCLGLVVVLYFAEVLTKWGQVFGNAALDGDRPEPWF